MAGGEDEIGRVELVEERMEVGTREVERGRVVIRTRVETREAVAEAELRRDEVEVECVPIDRPVDVVPTVREEGGVLVVPILEEQIVVTKRLDILKEELRICRRTRIEAHREPMLVRSQRAEVTREPPRNPDQPQAATKWSPSMSDRTLTAMYDSSSAAEAARDALVAAVPSASVAVHGNDRAGEDGGFWDTLKSMFFPDEDRAVYSEGLRRGSYVLTAEVPTGFEEQALDVLEQSDAVDVDERSAGWGAEGWDAASMAGVPGGSSGTVLPNAGRPEITTGGVDAAAAASGDATLADTGTRPGAARSGSQDETIPVVEEDLRVGKREVGRGSLRVRSYVVERPVEKQVELRQEHVSLERRPVDREIAGGEAAFQERTIEAVEHGEEAVVSKKARVTEEIGLRKNIETETGTVRDTVRKQEVEIEDDRGPRKPTGTGTVIEGDVVDPDLAGTSR